MPYSLMVCADEERIWGLQLTLAMKRSIFEGEEELIEKYGKQDYIASLDKMIDGSIPRKMEFIGSPGPGTCTTTMFQKTGREVDL